MILYITKNPLAPLLIGAMGLFYLVTGILGIERFYPTGLQRMGKRGLRLCLLASGTASLAVACFLYFR